MNADNLKKEIKKVKVSHIALLCAGIFLAFAIIGTILVMAGGGLVQQGGFHLSDLRNLPPIGLGQLFDVDDKFDLDMNGVDRIEITSVSADVSVVTGKGFAELKGQCRSTTKPMWLETRKQGSTLIIEVKYPIAGNNNSNVQLTVTIPEEYAGAMKINSVSSSIMAEGLPYKLGQVNLHTVSGDIRFSTASYTDLAADTISGEVSVSGIAARTKVTTTSGDINLDYSIFTATTVGTISGEVRATLPEKSELKVNFGSVSGEFSSNLPGLGITGADGGFNGGTTNGTESFNVNTTSGGFRIVGK